MVPRSDDGTSPGLVSLCKVLQTFAELLAFTNPSSVHPCIFCGAIIFRTETRNSPNAPQCTVERFSTFRTCALRVVPRTSREDLYLLHSLRFAFIRVNS